MDYGKARRLAALKKVNRKKQTKVNTMMNILIALDDGYLPSFGVEDMELLNLIAKRFEDNLNSYNAQQIAKIFGVSVNKQKLLRFANKKTPSQLRPEDLEKIEKFKKNFLSYYDAMYQYYDDLAEEEYRNSIENDL